MYIPSVYIIMLISRVVHQRDPFLSVVGQRAVHDHNGACFVNHFQLNPRSRDRVDKYRIAAEHTLAIPLSQHARRCSREKYSLLVRTGT